MYGQDRRELRHFYLKAWHKYQADQPLEPVEQLLAEIIRRHPEYQPLLEDEETVDQDYTPEQGQTNPFLHMGMHMALKEQVSTDRPGGIGAIYRQLAARHGDDHEAEHQMMECLGEALWEAQRAGQAPDEQAYLECLSKLV